MVNKKLLAPCGLYCGICGTYYADKNDDFRLKEKLAMAYGDTPDRITCDGCMSENPYWFCTSCPIKSCATGKVFDGCHQCDDFPCPTIEAYPIPQSREHMLRAVPRWRELGTDAWVKEEEDRFSCKQCGARLFRGARKCRQCGALI